MEYAKEKFNNLTKSLLGSSDGRAWIKMFKDHPDIQFWNASTKQGKGLDNASAFFDGTKHPFRIVDHILDNSE